METTNTYFEVVIGDQVHGYECIDFNKRCNYIKDVFGNFIAFIHKDEEDQEILLRVINKDKIIQIKNIGTEE